MEQVGKIVNVEALRKVLEYGKEYYSKVLAVLRTKEVRKVFGGGIVVVVFWYLRKFMRYMKWRKGILKAFPGPKPNLVLGDLSELIRAGGFNEKFFENLHGEYGEFTRFFLSPTMLNLSVVNPEHVVELYKKTRSRPFETEMFLHYLGKDNLLFTHGPMVKQMRLRYGKMVSNLDQLRRLNEVSFDEFAALTSTWGHEGAGVNVHKLIGKFIYDVMGKVMFGGSWSTTDIGQRIYEKHMYLIKNTNKWMFWPFAPVFLPEYNEYVNTIKEWRDLCEILIDERAEAIRQNPKKYMNDESALTMLVTSKDSEGKPFFSKSRAISTMCGFLNGAYDTTHATLYWLFYNLAKFPEKQDKLKRELAKVIGTKTRCSVEEARDCEYLDAFIKESMRFSTTVPVNQRVNYEEDITIGDFVVPKGTNVNVPMSIVFRDKRCFGPDSDSFRPERFLSNDPYSEKAKRAWTAFGGHARMCVGFTFALVELKACLITVLQQYDIKLLDANDSGEKICEVGVNQPENKALFVFKASNSKEQMYERNLEWWTPPREKKKRTYKTSI
mmetsp:Transcript_28986/g.46759  ORF Transcript_28986/g.46759 Transcript_28986/m.46759 type:complete len:553 (+) Transcript_28986:231-1889(+)